MSIQRRRRTSSGPAIAPSASEWVGGRLSAPFWVSGPGNPFRPDMVLWLELPSGLVVGQAVVPPAEREGALAHALEAAFEQPLAGGRPRRPARIRVADAGLAHEVYRVVGNGIPIRVAPTPELDGLLEHLAAHLSGGTESEPSYLERGTIGPDVVGRLFQSALPLFTVAPWKVADDDHVVRMDSPILGVEGACISIIGKLGQRRGVIIFPSLAGYRAFLAASDVPPTRRRDFGTSWIALTFEHRNDLPSEARREAETHGWRVAAGDAYPWIGCHERDGMPRPVTERDVEVVAACAQALAAFFLRHESAFTDVVTEPVCESCFDSDDVEVRFTLPYEAAPFFDVSPGGAAPDEGARGKVGRNDPCPCGSGRKYKKCHGSRGEANGGPSPIHEMDRTLVTSIVRHAEQHWREEWNDALRYFPDPQAVAELAVAWTIYTKPIGGATLAEHFFERCGARLSPEERSWIAAQRQAWLSVWEVRQVEGGKGLVLQDFLSGQSRHVHEVSASETLQVRDAVLTRVVDYGGGSLLCGMHPRALLPREAAEVVRRMRSRLRRRREVPIERLRDPAVGRYLVERWREGVAACEARSSAGLSLQNADGDSLLLTTDHFRLSPGARDQVAQRLSATDGASPEEPGEDGSPAVWVFLRADEGKTPAKEATVVGRAELIADVLRVETNSRERADTLRRSIEATCGDLLHHQAREHADPLSKKLPHGRPRESIDEPVPAPEFAQLVLAHKERHYAGWSDVPLPALGGRTPRQAVSTARGRSEVDVLLKEMERAESRAAQGTAYSFAKIRRELQLE